VRILGFHIQKLKCWRYAFAVILLLTARPLLAAPSEQDKQDAAEHYRKATAAFGLGDYAAAAGSYEDAFALIPDHALLYNAALAHERAGNVERARTLFTNYLRLFPRGDKAGDARRHLEQEPSKSQAAEPKLEDKPTASAQPQAAEASPAEPESSPPPVTGAGAFTATHSAAASAPAPNPSLVAAPTGQTVPEPATTSLWRRPWFWGALAVVAVAGAVAIGFAVASSRPTETPLWGRI
jgi:tetratricopeptide (TPR) repeat protein